MQFWTQGKFFAFFRECSSSYDCKNVGNGASQNKGTKVGENTVWFFKVEMWLFIKGKLRLFLEKTGLKK